MEVVIKVKKSRCRGSLDSCYLVRPSQGFWGTGGKGHLFQRSRGKRPNVDGNRGTKPILGTGNIFRKTNFGEQVNTGTGIPL